MELYVEASDNFTRHIERNSYPGRGLILGRSSDAAAWLQVYWIMGRSPNSRNRIFEAEGAILRTAPHDPAKLREPALVIYEAMLELPGVHIVSNGDQTRTIRDEIASGGSFESALQKRAREPDPPNYTPRISGLIDLREGKPVFALSILKANPADPNLTDRTSFRPAPPPPGLGLALTTYQGDGDPLPSFAGEPLWLPLEGDPDEVADRYWKGLDADNRVALAIKRIPADGGAAEIILRNRFTRD
jgi:IMP cyclohydrolase